MRLLVTGAGGLIGSHVIRLAAAEDGIELIATARRRPATLPPSASFAAADLAKAEEATALIREQRPTHIIHAAWETRHPTYWNDIANLGWVTSTARMAVEFAAVGGRRFVQLGSCAEYDWSHGLCVEGVTPDHPATRYGQAKLAAFQAIEAAAMGGFEAVEARIFWVFGPGENSARLIPLICRSHLAGTVPELGSGSQRRDLVYAEDAAAALLALARADGVTGTVNIGSGEPVPLATVATLLGDIAGASETGVGHRPDLPGDPALLSASSDRIRSIGWAPKWPLDEALAETYRWWAGQREAGR